MEKKEIRELKSLLKSYKRELSEGNKKHAKDSIAALVLLDLKDYPIELMNLEETTLKTLMFWGITVDQDVKKCFVDRKSSWLKVPNKEEFKALNNKYKTDSSYKYPKKCNEIAATTWLEGMNSFGMIKEDEYINLEDYKFTDLVTDKRLKSFLRLNEKSLFDFCVNKKTK
jgi:hypothetical protein